MFNSPDRETQQDGSSVRQHTVLPNFPGEWQARIQGGPGGPGPPLTLKIEHFW